jgi:hypothetical protein
LIKILEQEVIIDWTQFRPDTSFFIPCVDRTRAQRLIINEAKHFGVTDLVCRQVIERGVYGLRVWRSPDTLSSHSASTEAL